MADYKDYIDQIKELTSLAIKRVSQQTSMELNRFRKELDAYDFKKQINFRRTLIDHLPVTPMRIDRYMETVSYFLTKYNVSMSPKDYQLFLIKAGFVQDGMVCSKYAPDVHDYILLLLKDPH